MNMLVRMESNTMKKYLLISLICLSGTTFADSPVTEKSTDSQKVGYSFGYLMGKSNANAIDDLDLDTFMQGFKQGFGGQEPHLTNEQMVQVLSQYKKRVEAEELVAFQKVANNNLQEGNAFLVANAKKASIQSTQSGLQYEVLKQGNGKKANATSNVKVHYEGRLLDGTIFDSSIARDEPVTLSLDKVIKGWQEGVQIMPEGSKYRFFIPAKLAYGEIGSGEFIPPNSTLIFDIELIKVES